MNDYKNTISFYDTDCEYLYIKEDIGFYLSVIKPHSRVLELGCGTGRIGIQLIQHNCVFSGIDFSEKALNIFKEKAFLIANNNNSYNLICENIENFSTSDLYDWIIIPFSTYLSLNDFDAKLNLLLNYKKNLNKNGKLIIAVANIYNTLLKNTNRKKIIEYEFENKKIIRYINPTCVDENRKIVEFRYEYEIYEPNGNFNFLKDDIKLHFLSFEEYLNIFKLAQFTIVEQYGDYRFNPISSISKEWVFILK